MICMVLYSYNMRTVVMVYIDYIYNIITKSSTSSGPKTKTKTKKNSNPTFEKTTSRLASLARLADQKIYRSIKTPISVAVAVFFFPQLKSRNHAELSVLPFPHLDQTKTCRQPEWFFETRAGGLTTGLQDGMVLLAVWWLLWCKNRYLIESWCLFAHLLYFGGGALMCTGKDFVSGQNLQKWGFISVVHDSCFRLAMTIERPGFLK